MESQILPRKRVEQILSRAWVWETLAQHTDILAHDAALRTKVAWLEKKDAMYEISIIERNKSDRSEFVATQKHIAELEVNVRAIAHAYRVADKGRQNANYWLERITGPATKRWIGTLRGFVDHLKTSIPDRTHIRWDAAYCLEAICDYITREQGEGKSASGEENLAHDGPQLLAKDDPATWEYCSGTEQPAGDGLGFLASDDPAAQLRELQASEANDVEQPAWKPSKGDNIAYGGTRMCEKCHGIIGVDQPVCHLCGFQQVCVLFEPEQPAGGLPLVVSQGALDGAKKLHGGRIPFGLVEGRDIVVGGNAKSAENKLRRLLGRVCHTYNDVLLHLPYLTVETVEGLVADIKPLLRAELDACEQRPPEQRLREILRPYHNRALDGYLITAERAPELIADFMAWRAE